MKEHQGSYQRQFALGMVGYVIVILAVAFLLNRGFIQSPFLTVVVALTPIIPFFYAMVGMIGNARSKDELQRRIYMESALFAVLLTGALTFSYGLLENFDLAPTISMIYVAPLMILLWGIANIVLGRRYA
ncbi:MAG: hypothetical protein R3C44_10555 [Chloroflexota bacterium]